MSASASPFPPEDGLAALARTFQALEEHNPDGFMAFRALRDAAGRIEDFTFLYMNPAAERLSGRLNAACQGRRLDDVAPGSRAQLFETQKRVVETQTATQTDFEYQNEFGKRWYRAVNVPCGDGLITRFHSICAQKQAEQSLKESHAELAAVLENTYDGFCILDADWRFTLVNKRAEKLLRHARASLLGHCFWDVFPELAGAETQRSFFEAGRLKVNRNLRVVLATVGRTFEVRLCPTPRGMCCYWHDVTARDDAQAALHRETTARQAAEQALEEEKKRVPSLRPPKSD